MITAENKAKKAVQALENLEKKILGIDMKGEEMQYQHIPMYNVWRPFPPKMASEGVMSSSVYSSGEMREIVYIPEGGHVKPHQHPGVRETIISIQGIIFYKLYESDQYSEVIEEGVINCFETLEIKSGEMHYIFTTETDAYMIITWNL